jgi:small subunit ribosomal protein S24e
MNILKEKPLPLLKRKRVTAEIEHFKKPTPSKKEVVKTLADKLKVKEETISLLHAYSHYGVEKTKVIANVYESKEALEAVEKINKKVKKDKKKGEAPAEQPKAEEAPKEEKVEAKKDGKETSKEQKTK